MRIQSEVWQQKKLMNFKIIKTEGEYESALARIEEIWDAEPGTAESDELEVLSVLVEAYEEKLLAGIRRVTYRLYDDFKPRKVVATEAKAQEFELWLNVYGEFTIVAYAEMENGEGIWLARYLDLPGRPPD